jgi:hypothetical protein
VYAHGQNCSLESASFYEPDPIKKQRLREAGEALGEVPND